MRNAERSTSANEADAKLLSVVRSIDSRAVGRYLSAKRR